MKLKTAPCLNLHFRWGPKPPHVQNQISYGVQNRPIGKIAFSMGSKTAPLCGVTGGPAVQQVCDDGAVTASKCKVKQGSSCAAAYAV